MPWPTGAARQRMIDMVRRHEIQVLRRAGHSLGETATLVGVSQSSVQRVVAEPPVTSFDTDAERAKREVGRLSKAEPFRSFQAVRLRCGVEIHCAAWGDHRVPVDGGSARDLRAAAITARTARQLTGLLRHRPPA